MGVVRRLLNRWHEPALHAEFDEELRFHLDARVDANERAGMTRADAEAEARRHIGSTLRATEGMREARISGLFEGLARDIRHAARMVRRQPATAFLAVLTLSLGIGANAAIFSLLNAALFRPLPFPDAGRLVAVVDRYRGDGGGLSGGVTGPTIPELLDVTQRSQAFAGLSFFDMRDTQTYGGLEPARVFAARVEPSMFSLLAVRAAHGRTLRPEDSAAGADPVVVLSDGIWRRSFGADPSAVGRSLTIDRRPFAIVGVLPPDFSIDYLSPEAIEIYLPYPMIPIYTSRSGPFANVRRVTAVARLQPDVSLEQASAEVRTIGGTLVLEHPEIYRADGSGRTLGFEMDVQPLRDLVSGPARRTLLLLWSAVGLVLLIACVNTAQLLMAQAIEREPEMALRGALGAGRARLARQLLAESLLLSCAAGAAGALQAVWLSRALRWLLLDRLPVIGQVSLDLPVWLVTAGAALGTTTACALLPVLRLARVGPGPHLDGRSTVVARGRPRHLLIAVEVAVSVILLVGAGLVVRSLMDLQRARGGFSSDGVTLMRLRGMSAASGPVGPLGATYRRYLERISQLPGVEAVALTSSPVPPPPGVEFTVVGQPADAAALARQSASYQMVSGEYFAVLRIPLLQGRTFNETDVAGRQPVAIVSAELARRLWPGRSALGQQIHAGPGPRAATMSIVGVVGNVRSPRQLEDAPQIYVPILQQDEPSVALLVRPRPAALVSASSVKQAIWSIVPQQAVFGVRPLDEVLSQAMDGDRAIAILLASFALLALAISTAGVYTVVTYITARRTREIALRRAIGATAYDVLTLIAGPTLTWTIGGLLAGIAGAVAVSGVFAAALPGVATIDAATVALLAGVYLTVVAAAMCVPALRALRLEPAGALRAE